MRATAQDAARRLHLVPRTASAPGHPEPDAVPAGSEAYFRSLLENARDVIHVINPDGTTRYITPSVTSLLGWSPEELVGRDALELVHPEDRAAAVAALQMDRRSPGAGSGLEFRVPHRDGSWRTFEGVGRNLLDDPVVRGIIVNSRDVTERKHAEAEGLRLAAFPRASPDPILECDRGGSPVYVNPACERLARELGVRRPERLLPREHATLVAGALEAGSGRRDVEVRVRDRVFAWNYHPQARLGTVYLFGREVTEQKRVEERLRHSALHDPLTGLPNRFHFMERLAAAQVRADRDGSPFAVLFLDLDRFKVVNDSLGHQVGDELLIAVARRLRGCVRATDTVARFGGDEFALLLDEVGELCHATAVAERIAGAVAAPVALDGFEVFTSASIGIVLAEAAGGERPEELLRNADMAMYRAKGGGGARYEVFDRAMHAQALARLQMETDLRRALARQEFRLVYQPIVSLHTGELAGVEALVRWQHPERGLVSPGEFIPTAEETGVIVPLGDWVLAEACRQLAEWRAAHPSARLAVSVNLSPRQFHQKGLVERVRAVLDETGLKPRHLKLEITESAIMDGAGSAGATLAALQALGVEMQLDDFGTGYSSLASLHRLPMRALKVDRSFVSRIEAESPTLQLVRTIAVMARGLGLAVVAEGVETEEQLAAIREIGCDYAQGYLVSRPAEPEAIHEMLREQRRW